MGRTRPLLPRRRRARPGASHGAVPAAPGHAHHAASARSDVGRAARSRAVRLGRAPRRSGRGLRSPAPGSPSADSPRRVWGGGAARAARSRPHFRFPAARRSRGVCVCVSLSRPKGLRGPCLRLSGQAGAAGGRAACPEPPVLCRGSLWRPPSPQAFARCCLASADMVIITTSFSKEEIIKETAAG
ncbi:uncharacterized protein LJ264_003773 [Porphyrio hochstetteri]